MFAVYFADHSARGFDCGDAFCACVCWARGFLVALSVGYAEGLVGFDPTSGGD